MTVIMDKEDVGRYEGVPDDTYHHDWDACNHSRLKQMQRSAKRCRHMIDHPEIKEDTDSQILGKAIHCAILEPERFDASYAAKPDEVYPPPKGARNRKAYQTEKANLEVAGYQLLDLPDFDGIRDLRDRFFDEPSRALDLVKSATGTEVSYVIQHPETDTICKIRPDLEARGAKMQVDVKTSRSADVRAFEAEIAKWSYHTSTMFYMDLLQHFEPDEWRHHCFLVLENTAPWEYQVLTLEPAAMMIGQEEYLRWLRYYAQCVEDDLWPGYQKGIASVGLPNWKYIQAENALADDLEGA